MPMGSNLDGSVGGVRVDRRRIGDLCRRFRVRRLDLFGSAVSDHFDPESSDIDVLVEFESLGPADYADAYFGLREGLEAFFGRNVDLVTESALANPFFRENVLATRQALFTEK